MAGDRGSFGEGLGVKGPGGSGKGSVDHKRRGVQKMVAGAIGTIVAVILGYFSINLFVEGYQEYHMAETLGVTDALDVERTPVKIGGIVGETDDLTLSGQSKIRPPRQMIGYLTLDVTRCLEFDEVENRCLRYADTVEHYGPNRNLIVNAGENYLVDALQGTTEPENLRYHGIGTGSTAAAETDTGCQTELTTQYNPDNTRATGSLTEGASTNIFRTQGTITVDATATIAEFCLMSQAATGGGTMWSRVLLTPTVGLNSGDSLQTTYDLTVE